MQKPTQFYAEEFISYYHSNDSWFSALFWEEKKAEQQFYLKSGESRDTQRNSKFALMKYK